MSKTNSSVTSEINTKTSVIVWVGRVVSAAVCALFLFSAGGKLMGGEQVTDGMQHLGIPVNLVMTLAVLELTGVILYAIPQTAVIGAILLTGYMGGAILGHLRVGDTPIVQTVLPVLVWLGLYLRDARLRSLIPLRSVS